MSVNKNLKTVPSPIYSEHSDIPTEPNDSLEEDSAVTTGKRKAHRNDQSPRKRQRVASHPVSVIDLTQSSDEEVSTKHDRTERKTPYPRLWTSTSQTAKGTKRKSVNETETSNKRLRTNSHSGEATKVSTIDLTQSSDEEVSTKHDRTERETSDSCLWTSSTSQTAKGTKRKSVTETETSNKRLRTNSHTGEATKVSVIDLTPSSDEAAINQTGEGRKVSAIDSIQTSRDIFEAKYVQLNKLGQGGFGSVYAGYRKTDNLPVAIKIISKEGVAYQTRVIMGQKHKIPMEVIVMQRLAAGDDSVGKSAAVSLLDWYDLDNEVLLVIERPVPCVDMAEYTTTHPLKEHEAKDIMRQLVDAAIQMHSQGVFHQDIKQENILIETSTDIPRVRIIDFGCASFVSQKRGSIFNGTRLYVPPEFFSRGTYAAGPTTVWQLGAVLYEILSGWRFNTTNFITHHDKEVAELEMLKVTKDCKDLLKMCLSIKPKQRANLKHILLHPWFN